MITALVSRLMILAFGTLYPAYASYKAVRNKDVKEYVKWMMYWIVFALFTCAETFTDEIDEMLAKAKERGYNTVLSIGSKSVSYATNVILQTAMKGGGGLMDHIKKSYSLTDLSPAVHNVDVVDNQVHRPQIRGRRSTTTSASTSGLDISFPEVDHIAIRQTVHSESFSDVRSNEDISSGYSSTDQLFTEGVMTRSASVNARSKQRGARQGMSTRRSPLAEDSDDWDEEFWDVDTGSPIADPYPDSTNLEIKENFSIHRVDPASKLLGELNISESLEKINSLLKLSPHGSQCSLTSLGSNSKSEERKGKYNKPPAPKPKDAKSEIE